MNCRRFRDQVDEYVDDTPSAAERAAMERHQADCADCQRALQQRQALGLGLRRAFTEATVNVVLSSHDRRDILRAVEAGLAPRSVGQRAWAWLATDPRRALAPVGLALAVIAVVLQLRAPATIGGGGSAVAVNYSVDVPFATDVHVFQMQDGAVVDAVVTQFARSDASYTDSP